MRASISPRRRVVSSLLVVGTALALTACDSGSSPSSPSSTSRPVLYDGDAAKVPLDGSTGSPLVWQQPDGLTGDAADVAGSDRRLLSLLQILASGSGRPTDVRIDPLLSQFVVASDPTATVAGYGDQNAGNYGGKREVGTLHTKLLDVAVTGDTALVSFCTYSTGAPDVGAGPAGETFQRASGDTGVTWQLSGVANTTSTYDCAAWAASIKGGATPSS